MSRRKRIRVGDVARIVKARVRPANDSIIGDVVRVVDYTPCTLPGDGNYYPYTAELLTHTRDDYFRVGDRFTLERADMQLLDPGTAALYGYDVKENGQ